MKSQMIRSLTFQDGRAEEAMTFYVDLFAGSKVLKVSRWPAGGPVEEGKIMQATFELAGNLFMCSDSPAVHAWGFSPAVSQYLECDSEAELDELCSRLTEGGEMMMPPANYGFSQRFAWVSDQFGVSWQLNLS